MRSLRPQWDRARHAAGLGDLQLRDLRHESGSRFDEAGVPINYVSKILGHTSLATTSRYLNIQRRGLQLAIEKLDQHQSWSSVAHALHKDAETAPAVAPSPVGTSSDKRFPW